MSEIQNDKGTEVLMVLDNFFPSDLRVRKEFTALLDAGYNVTLVCYRKKGQKKEEKVLGCRVIRSSSSVSNFQKGLIDMYNAVFFINPVLNKALNNLRDRYDVIHVHDLPPANTALRYGNKHKMKTILDLHENYPEAIKVWFAWRKGFAIKLKNMIFFNYRRWLKHENKMVTKFDFVLAVVDEMKTRIIENHGIQDAKVTVISNTEPKDIFTETTATEKVFDSKKIIYVGGIGPHRGLDTAIRGIAILRDKGLPFELIIVGSGNTDAVNHLKAIAAELKVNHLVKFTGQLPFEEALQNMQTAFLNIIPHSSNGHTDNAIPHKLFQIMNSGYPLMVSSSAPLRRIVSKYEAGVIFEADNPVDFAEKVIWADHNHNELHDFVNNAKDAVRNKGLNWETDGKKLVEFYNSFSA